MTSGRTRPLVIKEIRALWPAWFATMFAIGAAALSGPRGHFIGLLAYAFGSVTLGAQSIGHEYTHHTLTLLLSQPSSRRRLLLMKAGVLSALLLLLAVVARLALLRPGEGHWIFASILCGVSLAPLLTMVCRNALAAPVFVAALPAWISFFNGFLSMRVVWGVTLGVCVPAAAAGWRMFMRLEVIDGRGADVRLPRMLRREIRALVDASPRTRHPLWLLVKKELHLQQMTFAVAGAWVVIWIAITASFKWIATGLPAFPLPVVSILYGALLALLIGSTASAEERQIGTLEWQVLLPMPAWKQWAVKVGTALALAGLLSFAIPVALAAGHVGVNAWHAGSILILTVSSLYVSSLCRSAIRALMISAPVMLALAILLQYVYVADGGWPSALLALPFAGVVVLMLWFGLENHRSTEQSAGRVSRQLAWLAGCLALLYFVP